MPGSRRLRKRQFRSCRGGFFAGETERTCQALPAIRSYVITSSASRWPRFRVRIERFYYDVDYLRSGSNSADGTTYIGGRVFSCWPMKLVTKEFLFLFARPKWLEVLKGVRSTVFFVWNTFIVKKTFAVRPGVWVKRSLAPSIFTSE